MQYRCGKAGDELQRLVLRGATLWHFGGPLWLFNSFNFTGGGEVSGTKSGKVRYSSVSSHGMRKKVESLVLTMVQHTLVVSPK